MTPNNNAVEPQRRNAANDTVDGASSVALVTKKGWIPIHKLAKPM
jgi:hypothetical protein